jgi:DNA polymerase-3 subunit delta
MIIFLYGPDTYRSKQKLNEIIEHYKKIHQSGLNLKFFDEENLNFQSLKDTLFSTPIFKEKKLLVLKNIFSNQNFKENFLKEKERFINSEDIFLIYEKKEISKDDPLFQFLKKNSKFQEFNLLDNQKLKNWIKKELEKKDAQISPKALEKLIEYVGNNLWRVSNEIKKLVSYKKGEIIQEKDIELLVKPKIETDIFKTINAIAEKKKDKALILLHQHLEKGDSPLYLLFMINFQFRYLLIVKEMIEKNIPYYIILNQIKLPSFVVRKILEQSKKFTLQQLKKIYQKIFQKDLQIKTGKIEPETALDILIAEI